MFRRGKLGPIEWAAVRRPRPGEQVCGDHPVAVEIDDGAALFGVIDGLGHGKAAQTAALCAVQTVENDRSKPLDVVMQRCHHALTRTRGVAMTLARIDFRAATLSWIGIGNVSADLVAKGPAGVEVRASALLAGGIVGYRMPPTLPIQQVPLTPGDLLVIASDGIGENYLHGIDFAAQSIAIAEDLVRRYGRDTDDALVLVARHRGAS